MSERVEDSKREVNDYDYAMKFLQIAYKQLLFGLSIALTVYAALNISTFRLDRVSGRSSRPFFSADSPVTDLYGGDLRAALAMVPRHHLTLIYLYAPWDRRSAQGRPVLDAVHRVLGDQVRLVAVNCWHPSGGCRKELKQITHFPLLVAYMRYGKGIEYRGPIEAVFLIQFLQQLILPLTRVHSLAQLSDLRTSYTTVVMGYASLDGGDTGHYFQLLRAAILWREREPLDSGTIWTLVTGAGEARVLALSEPGSLAVLNWNHNDVLLPPRTGRLTVPVMHEFVSTRRHPPAVDWLELADHKSDLFDRATTRPTLLVLAPRDPGTRTLNMVRRVWVEYNKCNQSSLAALISRQLDALLSSDTNDDYSPCCSRGYCTVSAVGCLKGDLPCRRHHPPQCVSDAYTKQHPDIKLDEMRQQRMQMLCGMQQLYSSHSRSPSHSAEAHQEHSHHVLSISGLACSTNRTLDVALLDSVRHSELLHRLLGRPAESTAAVILDRQTEDLFLLPAAVSVASLSRFIRDYTHGRLSRHLPPPAVTIVSPPPPRRGATVFVTGLQELDSASFTRLVNNVTQDAVVLFYSPGCGHCTAVQHVFLLVYHLLHRCGLTFCRIDVANNQLPWHFTMYSLPTILYLPAISAGDSDVFPAELPITMEHLLRFTLSNAPSDMLDCFLQTDLASRGHHQAAAASPDMRMRTELPVG